MTNLLSCTKHATELLEMIERSDVTVLSFNVDLDYKNRDCKGDPVARFAIHCWMDEWFWTWAEQYSHERIRTVTGTEEEVVPFLDGQVFAQHFTSRRADE